MKILKPVVDTGSRFSMKQLGQATHLHKAREFVVAVDGYPAIQGDDVLPALEGASKKYQGDGVHGCDVVQIDLRADHGEEMCRSRQNMVYAAERATALITCLQNMIEQHC